MKHAGSGFTSRHKINAKANDVANICSLVQKINDRGHSIQFYDFIKYSLCTTKIKITRFFFFLVRIWTVPSLE